MGRPAPEPVLPEVLVFYADGSCRGNPGPGSWAWHTRGVEPPTSGSGCEDLTTNNRMEYRAVIEALRYAKSRGATRVRVHTDSRLVYHQIRGEYQVKENRDLWREAVDAIGALGSVELVNIPRHLNAEADALARRALRTHQSRKSTGA